MKNSNFRDLESFRDDTTRTLILVDWANLMYRAWFASSEQPWVASCKFFDMLRLCIRKAKEPGVPVEIIFCGESRTILERKKLFPEYKGTRKYTKNEEFAVFRYNIEHYIGLLGYRLLRIDGAEADDIIASIVHQICLRKDAPECTTDIVIFSGDRDLQQLLAWKRVLIYRAPGLFVDYMIFEETVGIPIAKYNIYKALVGDSSDNISGVQGFGPVKARTAINSNSVAYDIITSGGHKAAEQFKLALRLVNLDTRLNVDLSDIHTGRPNLERLAQVDKRVVFEIKRFAEEFNV